MSKKEREFVEISLSSKSRDEWLAKLNEAGISENYMRLLIHRLRKKEVQAEKDLRLLRELWVKLEELGYQWR